MSEPEDPRDDEGAEETPSSRFDAALGAFKPRDRPADSSLVSESGRSGMTWSPVTDAGTGNGTETEPRPRSSFQFDLGSALAKLGGAVERPPADEAPVSEPDEPADPLPTRARQADSGPTSTPSPVDRLPTRGVDDPVDPLPTRGVDPVDPLPTRGGEQSVDPLPTRGDQSPAAAADTPTVQDRLPTRSPRSEPPAPQPVAPEPAVAPERPVARQQPTKSVFDSANPSPTLPTSTPGAGTSLPPHAAGASASAPPTVPIGDASMLPTLPATVPAAPPPVIAPIESAPSTPQLNALRSAQLRADRNDRRGKLFGRSVLALLVVGGVVAAALLFGRSYLFPTEWDAELTPLVDDVQSARGVEFDDTLALVERPTSEYAPLVAAHVLGADWNTRLPEWRALGLAGGDGAVADVQVRIASLYPAFFDPESETIVASAERTADAREPALRIALESALAHQLAGDGAAEPAPLGLTGLDAMDVTARRAYDAAAVGLVAGAPDAIADLAGVPVPVAYQLRAADRLGAALVDGVTVARPGDALPTSVARLDDAAAPAAGGLLQPGDQQVLEPVALGADDWALIWGTRLSPAIVGPMVDSLAADSYSVVSRSGVTCSVAVFQTSSEAAGAALLANLTTWTTSAAEGSQAVASQLGPDRVQVEACDPGADVTITPSPGATDLVIGRQLARLAG